MGLKMNHILKSIVGFFPRTVQFGGKWTATNKNFIFIFQGDQLEKLLHWEAVHLRPAVLAVLSGLIQVRLG
jgi:hypothetical protein